MEVTNYGKSATTLTAQIFKKIGEERARHNRWMAELGEEGLDIRPFTRGDAALAWQISPTKAGERIRELREVGLVRRVIADGKRMFSVVEGEGAGEAI